MATITISKTGNQYQLAVNGWSKSKGKLNMVVVATDEPLETAADNFAGNEEVVMRDASLHITAVGYLYVQSIERVKDYPVGGMDKYGDDILQDVWKVTLSDTVEEEAEEEPVELPFEAPPLTSVTDTRQGTSTQ